ncbi:hypothetical protein [Mucilaginibacter sp. UR6-11]|uniref:hypothetical protein n=1 Tax=Mucilaginibacter sp. UR6-11 TaxID=1435644 RepID=UPI001E5D7F6C|nr:hypothetical protein [Mucilaginibacter sp. UR6-11]MCC8424934.1 hypothetical protein [Mucilaginibacter sp. UR6-11]
MKRLVATLVMLTGTIAVNAQNPGTTFLQKLTPINKRSGNVCTCNTNRELLKSKATADWFQKATKLTMDTDRNKPLSSPDIAFKSGPNHTVYNNSTDQLLNTTAAVNPDHMPIAKLRNTDQRMPIVQTDKTAYTMPVAGKTQPRVYYQPVLPKNGLDGVVIRP